MVRRLNCLFIEVRERVTAEKLLLPQCEDRLAGPLRGHLERPAPLKDTGEGRKGAFVIHNIVGSNCSGSRGHALTLCFLGNCCTVVCIYRKHLGTNQCPNVSFIIVLWVNTRNNRLQF